MMQAANAVSMVAHRWFVSRHADLYAAAGDPLLKEALSIAMHDTVLIAAKLHRALGGQDRSARGEAVGHHPVQNDWNGSAKVALICLERSADAWQAIAQATGDATPAGLAAQMSSMVREVEEAFPHAREFVRPGFDDAAPRRRRPR
jgi:hypothetical protein